MKRYKLKNKSSAKKRFRWTKGGKGEKIILFHAKRRHNAQNRNRILHKQSRGNDVAHPHVVKLIKKYLMR
jgi:ribosomal protein L35